MDIEKILTIAAPPARVWELLLDPEVMGACIPGMQSVEVLSPTEYKALIAVKIAFVSAKFRLKTTILEQRAPLYLRCEGTGEDASVASSLRQQSEMFLAEQADGGTELRVKVKVDVLGRLGSFGLSVMKTKADRMWDEFGQNLSKRIAPPAELPPPSIAPEPASGPAVGAVQQAIPGPSHSTRVIEAIQRPPASKGWWPRLLASLSRRSDPACARHIRIELLREGATVTVHWPLDAAGECAALLRDCLMLPAAKE
ncbi:SRPBCC family protein [Variovorax guangxiensis]|uniref:CoxG family protein n=1 Tax=Variovorax guangxiensis TaxID=1775474 RepID=UPI002855ED9D|nr:SRPBCC family protein [Variovorax guangxiensis]MDR6855751.1 carbon monoxide dehydrogenase subunit G [Variovorax guangxiensis]